MEKAQEKQKNEPLSSRENIPRNELSAMVFAWARQSKQTDCRLHETPQTIRQLRESSKETDRQIRKLDPRRGGQAPGWDNPCKAGGAGEEGLLGEQRIPVHRIYPHAGSCNDAGKTVRKIDLLVVDGEPAMAAESKSRLTTQEVDERHERLARFKTFLPAQGDKILHGAVAALGASEKLTPSSDRAGPCELAQTDDSVVS
ncbi:MAG: hypothetical protein N2441_10215 [Rhodocyclaceae bacterium]|nr:hypothetical protein [Rhodocyclaceae bacterium]